MKNWFFCLIFCSLINCFADPFWKEAQSIDAPYISQTDGQDAYEPQIICSNDRFVAIWIQGNSVYAAHSDDGKLWYPSFGNNGDNYLSCDNREDAQDVQIAACNDRYVALWKQSDHESSRIYTSYSDDGKVWQNDRISCLSKNNSEDSSEPRIASFENRFVAIWTQGNSLHAAYSDDGITWTYSILKNNFSPIGNPKIICCNNRFIVTYTQSDNGISRIYAAYSDGGEIWNPSLHHRGSDFISSDKCEHSSEPKIACFNNRFIIVWLQNDGNVNKIYAAYSDGGEIWNDSNFNIPQNDSQDASEIQISYHNHLFVLISVQTHNNKGRICALYSDGGEIWHQNTSPYGNDYISEENQYADCPQITCCNGRFVAVWMVWEKGIYTAYSDDGKFWQNFPQLRLAKQGRGWYEKVDRHWVKQWNWVETIDLKRNFEIKQGNLFFPHIISYNGQFIAMWLENTDGVNRIYAAYFDLDKDYE